MTQPGVCPMCCMNGWCVAGRSVPSCVGCCKSLAAGIACRTVVPVT